MSSVNTLNGEFHVRPARLGSEDLADSVIGLVVCVTWRGVRVRGPLGTYWVSYQGMVMGENVVMRENGGPIVSSA